MQSFLYSEYTSLSLAKVWDGRAKLPAVNDLWRVHNEVVKERGGYGKNYMFLGAARTKGKCLVSMRRSLCSSLLVLQRFITAWLNEAAVRYGGRQVCVVWLR